MRLRMKNFNIMGVAEKGGGLGQFADIKGGAWRRRGVVFLRGVDYSNAHYGPYES